MAAFRKAMEAGADGIEFDVRLSRDGVPVVIHDASLQRTGLRPEKLSDLSVKELKQIDVSSWFFATRPTSAKPEQGTIPTLEELLDEFVKHYPDAVLYLELKTAPEQMSPIVSATCEMLKHHAARNRVTVECFLLTAIKEVKQRTPEIRTAALFEPAIRNAASLFSNNSLVDQAKSVGANEVALNHRLANRRTVEAALEAGLSVVVWTVDDPKWLMRAVELGIEGLITNDPELLVRHRTQVTTI